MWAETADMATDPKTMPPAVFQKRAGGKKSLAIALSRSTSFVAALLNRSTPRVQTSLPEADQYSHIANCIMYEGM